MTPPLAFVLSGLRLFFEVAQAGGRQSISGMMQLLPSLGTGSVQRLIPASRLGLPIFRCRLTWELALPRPADTT